MVLKKQKYTNTLRVYNNIYSAYAEKVHILVVKITVEMIIIRYVTNTRLLFGLSLIKGMDRFEGKWRWTLSTSSVQQCDVCDEITN